MAIISLLASSLIYLAIILRRDLRYFKKEVLDNVFKRVLAKQFAFDLEVLVNAHHLGYKITEDSVQNMLHYCIFAWKEFALAFSAANPNLSCYCSAVIPHPPSSLCAWAQPLRIFAYLCSKLAFP